MLKIVIELNKGCGRVSSWHALWMLCCHTVLSMHMVEVRRLVYWMTVVVGGGSVVRLAC